MDWVMHNLPAVITLILGVGIVWTRLVGVLAAIKELQDLLSAITAGLADKQLTEDELKLISKEAQELYQAVKNLAKK